MAAVSYLEWPKEEKKAAAKTEKDSSVVGQRDRQTDSHPDGEVFSSDHSWRVYTTIQNIMRRILYLCSIHKMYNKL